MQKLLHKIDTWRKRTPPSFTGPIWANILGWQVIRVLFFNLIHRFGSYRVREEAQPHAKKLEEEGVLIIENFLPPEVFSEIQREYQKEVEKHEMVPLASKYVIPAGGKTRVGLVHFFPEEGTRLRELLDTHFIQHPLLRELGAVVVRHEIPSFRPPQIFMNKKVGDEHPDLNSDMYYHADVSYPGVKGYLYLTDVGEDNGAFRFAKGTHKLTLKRLWWDYRKSIEHAKNRARVKNRAILGDETGRSWHCMTREEEKREGIEGTSMVGKPNSLVMFNVMGFHRRGDFQSDRPRAFAYAYYRDAAL